MTVKPAYVYAATVNRVIDSDTLCADVSLGFGIWLRNQSLRLAGCNGIEHDQPGGAESTANLTQLLPPGTAVVLRTVKVDKYARYDAAVTMPDGTDLIPALIADGWLVAWNGRGTKPVPPWPRPTGG